jgi:hypothetical protein
MVPIMQGIRVFESLEQARREGYVLFDKTADGYLVRRDLGGRFALAIVKIDTASVKAPAS